MRNPNTPQISSFAAAETARRAHEECILEIQRQPGVGARVIAGVELADGVERPIAHKLGRAPVFVRESCPRGAFSTGRVEEIRSTNDRAQTIILKATGWGGTITVDVLVA